MSASSIKVQWKHTQCYKETSGEERVEHVLRTADSPLLTTEQVSQHQLWSRLTHQRCSYSYCAGDNIQGVLILLVDKVQGVQTQQQVPISIVFMTLHNTDQDESYERIHCSDTTDIYLWHWNSDLWATVTCKVAFHWYRGLWQILFYPTVQQVKVGELWSQDSGQCSLLLFLSSAPSQWSLNLIARESFMVSTRTIFTARIKWSNDMITIH